MEVYILDSLFRREQVVDRFESLIWTERFSAAGDFELVIHSTPKTRSQFQTGIRIAINASHRVMTVETVENTTDDEGKSILNIKGRSLEAILDDRIARPNVSGTETLPKWILTNTPGGVARQMFQQICVAAVLNPNDRIPFIETGSMYGPDTIKEPPYEITWEQEPATLYEAIKGLCDLYDLGFRLTRDYDTSKLYFEVYTGSNRTSGQSLLPAVVFAPEMDNLQNTTSLKTIDQAKNCAYVVSDQGAVIVYPDDVDPEVEGFERRMLLVKADNVEQQESAAEGTEAPPVTQEQIQSHLIQKGKEELTKHRTFQAFDGEIDQNSNFKYGIHYNLGDLVEIRNSDGEGNNMRVTEQIFVSDNEGERSYPTLTLNIYINPGSWLTWDFNQVWLDMGEETWADV